MRICPKIEGILGYDYESYSQTFPTPGFTNDFKGKSTPKIVSFFKT